MSNPTPTIPTGPGTTAGLAGAAAAFVGAVVAATQGLTTEAVTAVIVAALTLLTVIGGRYAQAVATIKEGAQQLAPIVGTVASFELPEGENPDPIDSELDAGKDLTDEVDEVDELTPELLTPTDPAAVPEDHDDAQAADPTAEERS
jgi:hypothetical protein